MKPLKNLLVRILRELSASPVVSTRERWLQRVNAFKAFGVCLAALLSLTSARAAVTPTSRNSVHAAMVDRAVMVKLPAYAAP